jgi:UDP-N-acetylmuramoyl-L-alanyl-D-glutamate--2,6-diaminopimelate ligase
MALQPTADVGIPLSAVLAEADTLTEEVRISGLQLDSRLVAAGDAFLALPGEVHDGRNYLEAVTQAGASVIIAERGVTESQGLAAGTVPVIEVADLAMRMGSIAAKFYGVPAAAMHVVGITGTNGKTTTSRLLAQLLRHQFGQCGVIGTLGATLDDKVAEAVNTTPDAVSLQRQLAQWQGQGVAHAVLEVSSHSLVQGRVNALDFETAVFTNLTHDHLDYHGDMTSYGLAKSRLFSGDSLKTAIVNRDDPFSESIVDLTAGGVDVWAYSLLGQDAAVQAREVRYHDNGLEAHLSSPWGEGLLCSPLAGDFNLGNLLAAITAACVAGVPLARVIEWVPGLQGVPGRMEYVPNERGLQVVVDYAHTPDALEQALLALRAHTRGELICVFGCGGDRDVEKRPLMGRIASEHADRVIVTSDNPRNESPLAIIADIETGISGPAECEADRAMAIALAVKTARPGDCILVAGKGHESYQQVGEDRNPFSDTGHLRRALQGEGAK